MDFATNTFIRWFNADVVRPAKDGRFLCMTKSGNYTVLPYCAEARAFNVHLAEDDGAIAVQWWAEIPELPVKSDEK